MTPTVLTIRCLRSIMKITIVFSLAATCLFGMPSLRATGFDCAKAKTKIEKLICANPNLSELDKNLSTLYNQVLLKSPVPEDTKQQQREWVKESRNTCENAASLEQAYTSRISDLEEQLKKLPFKPALDTPLLVLPSRSAEERDAAGNIGAEIVKKEPLELIGRVSEGHNAAGANFLIVSGKKYYLIRYGWALTDEQRNMLTNFEGNEYVLLKGQLVTYKGGSKDIDPDSEVQVFGRLP